MNEFLLSFSSPEYLGKVIAVDTRKVLIDVESDSLLARTGVGSIVAVKGSSEQEYLIGMVERVSRNLEERLGNLPDNEDEIPIELCPEDVVRIVLIGTYRTVDGSRINVFKRGADSFPQIDKKCFVVEGKNLQNFMGLLAADINEDERLILGNFVADKSAAAVIDGDRFFQRHATILGSTGSGKSWTVALILERASKLKFPNIIVLDIHGEYHPLTDKTKGFAEGFRIAGPGDLKEPASNSIFLPYWLLNREEMLSMILDRSDMNAPNQASRLTMHIKDLKEKTLRDNGQIGVLETFTVDSPIPYNLQELIQLLNEDDTRKGIGSSGKEVKGDWEGKLTRLIARLQGKVDDRRYGFLFQPPTDALKYNWLAEQVLKLLSQPTGGRGIKIVDFSEVPSDVLPVVAGTFVRLLYDVQFWMRPEKRTPFTLLCDEAHLYLPVKDDADTVQKQALWNFERIAKEGRKYGVSLLVVSQRPSDVSRTILSQCNNFVVLRLTNEQDQSVVKRLMPDSMAGMIDVLPLLDIGESLILGDAILLPTRIKFDIPSIPPDSATKEFWKEWSTKSPDNDAIKEAVETLRRQTRPID